PVADELLPPVRRAALGAPPGRPRPGAADGRADPPRQPRSRPGAVTRGDRRDSTAGRRIPDPRARRALRAERRRSGHGARGPPRPASARPRPAEGDARRTDGERSGDRALPRSAAMRRAATGLGLFAAAALALVWAAPAAARPAA